MAQGFSHDDLRCTFGDDVIHDTVFAQDTGQRLRDNDHCGGPLGRGAHLGPRATHCIEHEPRKHRVCTYTYATPALNTRL
eukprot:7231380-Alexandrium_andersonii.AAC.1